jgi:menaquinone-dependent protoporphyrinogen oxidase
MPQPVRILIAVASRHGSTWEIAQGMADVLTSRGIWADVTHIEQVQDLTDYDGFIIGSAVYAGHWLNQALAFMYEHADELATRPIWLFSSGPLGMPLRPYDGKAVDISAIAKLVRIKEHRIFAGKLKKRRLNFAEKLITAAVHAPQGDYRNWDEIQAWAGGIAETLKRYRTRHHATLSGVR